MTKRAIIILVVIGLVSCLVGCGGMSSEEKEKAKKLVNSYSKSFTKQAKSQYGKNAKVKNISAETQSHYSTVWPTFETNTTGELAGTVEVDGETFDARYYVESNEIYSFKNHDKIVGSMNEYFGYLNLDIIDSTMTNGAYKKFYLPDNITSFEDMLNNEYFMLVHIYVTKDLKNISGDDFSRLETYWKEYDSHVGSIVFVQVDNQSSVNKLKDVIHEIQFQYSLDYSDYPKIYDDSAHDYVDAFDKYNILSSIYISHSDYGNKVEFNYLSK